MKKLLSAGIILAMTGLGMAGCYNDNSEELYPQPTGSNCDTSNVTYTAAIQPIFNQNCALSNCHATGSNLGGHILDTYVGATAAAGSGRLLGAISHASGYSAMPKNMPKLSECNISKIQAWINKGMPQ